MSKINLSGNALGSGTITIAAPNTNTNYSLALPEEAGTITTSNSPYSTFRNRIINGDMRVAQRGTSATPTAGGYFTIDRWRFGQGASYAASLTPTISQSSTVPAGFTNSFLYTNGTGSAPTSTQLITIDQYIEGLNCADLDFGSASAKTVTVSFWVRASVTGTYSVALTNSSIDRSYVAEYAISSADTWEYKTITIAGDTSGTWLKTNGTGILVRFPIGAGTDLQTTAGAWQAGNYYTTSACTNLTATTGATFYITGVQLEVGSVATPFERRPYGTELSLCQRYYYKLQGSGVGATTFGMGFNTTTAASQNETGYPVPMRIRPTALEQSGTAADYIIAHGNTSTVCSSVPIFGGGTSTASGLCTFTVASGLTAGQGCRAASEVANVSAFLAWSAEL